MIAVRTVLHEWARATHAERRERPERKVAKVAKVALGPHGITLARNCNDYNRYRVSGRDKGYYTNPTDQRRAGRKRS